MKSLMQSPMVEHTMYTLTAVPYATFEKSATKSHIVTLIVATQAQVFSY